MIVDKNHPFKAAIKERQILSKASSHKQTCHIVLDIKGSGIQYNVGDSIAVCPVNAPEAVERTLKAMNSEGREIITDKHGASHVLRDFLTHKANISEVSRKCVKEIALKQQDEHKKNKLLWLFEEGHKEALKAFLERHHLWDFLAEHCEVSLSPQELVSLLMPLLPRFYSIASSQKVVGDEVHLTVAFLRYNSNEHDRLGVCTNYLCELADMYTHEVPIYLQPHHGFTLPADPSTNIIMVGPGTGIAPFRAFMQERLFFNAQGKHWLFFGECHQACDYYYEDLWHDLHSNNRLHLDTAFSRDQEHKIYVQHRMLEKGEQLYNWLEQGASLFVCGDAHRMAKDVEATLHHIIEVHGQKSGQEAKEYVKMLRSTKRYLRDVY